MTGVGLLACLSTDVVELESAQLADDPSPNKKIRLRGVFGPVVKATWRFKFRGDEEAQKFREAVEGLIDEIRSAESAESRV